MTERRESYRVWVGKPETDNLKHLDIDGRTILKCTFKKWDRAICLINLAQDRDRWYTLLRIIMNFSVS
jgi:hypothetical protein